MGTGFRQKIINVSMDIEDIYGDPELLNVLLFDLIDFFNENKLPVDLYISGIRLPAFGCEEKLKKLVSDYSFAGYHSNTHSFYPIATLTVEQIPENEEHFFDFENKQFDYACEGGINSFRKYFSTKMFRCPGLCWTPDYFEYMKGKCFELTSIDIHYTKPFGYMGLFILPTNEKPLEAYQSKEELVQDIEKYESVSLYFHPARLVYDQFWDKSQNRNVYPDYKIRVSRLKELIKSLSKDYKIVSIRNMRDYYVDSIPSIEEKNELSSLLEESLVSKWKWSQLPRGYYNPYHIVKCRENSFSIVSYRLKRLKD